MLFLVAACFVCSSSPLRAQAEHHEPPNAHSSVGINLSQLVDYNSCWVFRDVFKTARAWIPQRPSGGPWNTGETLKLDANGWPILAPNQAAGTLLLNGIQGHYPAGDYLCLYDGDGDIDFAFDATIKSKQKGRIVVTVKTPGNGGIFVKIVRSNPNNYVRNVRLYMPGLHDGRTTFHPLFLSRLARFKSIRFMDWMRTNNSPVKSWANRTTKTTYSQALANGVALEYMIELCNVVRAEPWFCIPHLADDNYVHQFATMVKQRLNPDLRVHVEFSNEVWIRNTGQGRWAQQQGVRLKLHPDAYTAQLYYSVQRSVEVFKIFESVFGGTTRLQRVVSSQFYLKTAELVLNYYGSRYKNSADVFGIGPYFGWNVSSNPAKAVNMTVAQILKECAKSIDVGNATIAKLAVDAAKVRLGLVSYEAGQSLVTFDPQWQKVTKLIDLYTAANRAPGMKDLYLRYLQGWERNGGGLLCAYAFCRLPNKWGAWGVLEYTDQPRSQAPKYDALVTFVEQQRPLEYFGVGCNGLDLHARNQPRIGSNDFAVELTSNPPASSALFMISDSRTTWAGITLPFDLGLVGAPRCILLVRPSVMLAASVGKFGDARLTLPIQNNNAFLGIALYGQWLGRTPNANPFGSSTSRAVRIRVSR